jgi:tetratricopeptide (TPR) repeat protein
MLERPRPDDQAEAERLLRKALDANPGLGPAHVGLARIAIYVHAIGLDESPERLRTAREEAEAAIAIDPRDPLARAALARALAAADRLTPALEQALQAVAGGDDVAEAHLALCAVERLRGEIEAATGACRRAADLAPDDPRVLVGLAETLREAGDDESALVLFGQAADLDHESPWPQLGAAGVLQRQGRFGMASRTYDLILERFAFARTRVLQGVAALRVAAQDYDGALEVYETIDLPPGSTLPTLLSLYGKGYALLHLDRAAEAEYFLSTFIERVPAEYDGPARGREILFLAYDDLVRYFEGRGLGQKAEDLLRAAAARPLAPTRMARRLALRLQEKGDVTSAPAPLERALLHSCPREDAIELADTALLLARLRSSAGRKAVPPGSTAGQAIRLAAERIASSPLGVAHYRMARAFALSRDIDSSLASLEKARARGFLPADQAASENDFAILRGRAAFEALLKP